MQPSPEPQSKLIVPLGQGVTVYRHRLQVESSHRFGKNTDPLIDGIQDLDPTEKGQSQLNKKL